MTKTHELKVHFDFIQALLDGSKTFELRRDDRDFEVGDQLWLRAIAFAEPGRGEAIYLGPNAECRRTITYILRHAEIYGLQRGFCILGIKP